jgi:hypothetical protein
MGFGDLIFYFYSRRKKIDSGVIDQTITVLLIYIGGRIKAQ